MNVSLNPGGWIGAAVGGGLPLAILILSGNPKLKMLGLDASIVIIAGLVIGVLVGNLVWSSLVGKPAKDRPRKKNRAPKYEDEET
ncbi:MAG TPA: hypothetical protein VGF55_21730 [Gemmataceae bacterium]|jgi:hypothetical protein